MTSKKLISLSIVAALLVIAAYFSNNRSAVQTPSITGKPLLAKLDLSKVAKVEIANETTGPINLQSTDAGWVVESLYGYPADITRIRQALLNLDELKIGHTADASKLGDKPGKLAIKDAAGATLAKLTLGEKRMRAASEEMTPYGGGPNPEGRYVATDDGTFLIGDALEAFDGDSKRWVETKIASIPASDVTAIEIVSGKSAVSLTKTSGAWSMADLAEGEELDTSEFYSVESALSYLNFDDIADPALTPDQLGLTTGTVFAATLKNGESYTAALGNTAANSTGRYLHLLAIFTPVGTNETENAAVQKKVDAFNAESGKWIYVITANNAEKMMKKRADFIKEKPKPEPKATAPADKTPAVTPASTTEEEQEAAD